MYGNIYTDIARIYLLTLDHFYTEYCTDGSSETLNWSKS